jgi:hypothetical protein
VLDLLGNVDALFEEVDVSHSGVERPILDSLVGWVPLLKVGNDDLMDLQPELLFNALANLHSDILSKLLVDLLLVVINGYIW